MTQSNPPPTDATPPWELVVDLLATNDHDRLHAFVAELPSGEAPRLLARLDPAARSQLLGRLDPEIAALLLEHVSDVQVAELLTDAGPAVAAPILDTLPSNFQADILGELDDDDAKAVLTAMQPEEAADAQRLAQYDEHTAGGVMISEYLAFAEDVTVGDVLRDLRDNVEKYQRHDVQYIYVTGPRRTLKGVLRLRDLVLTRSDTPVREILVGDPDSVPANASLEVLDDFFDNRPYRGVPVVDDRGRLVGVVRHADVAEALGEQVASDQLKMQGIVGGEELRTMPVFTRAWRRLSWLSINVVLNIMAASIIAFYQDTLSAAIVLAVFLPIISDMSGCSGNQAIAVSMRELTLGVVTPADIWRVWGKELSVGLINACALGVLLGSAAFLWKGNFILSLVVGSALAINTLVAVSLGGLVPLVLRGLHKDPALASGPILTTVTDMCGFFLVLSFASVTLSHLG